MKYPKEIFVEQNEETKGEPYLMAYFDKEQLEDVDEEGLEYAIYKFSHMALVKRSITVEAIATKKR